MNDIFNFKPGCKFLLTKDFIKSYKDYRGEVHITTYPQNLMISVVNVVFRVTGIKMTFKVIRAKPIIEKFYTGIDPVHYHRFTWKKEFDPACYKHFTLQNEELEKFVSDGTLIECTSLYNQLTK